MTINEAKKILLAAPLNPLERFALERLLSAVDIEDLPYEEWRDVVDYEGLYQVSNFGRMKSFHRKKVKLLDLETDLNGYIRCGLSKNGKTKHLFVHVLVAQAFIPNPDPEHKTQVHHRDDNKRHCHVDNLQWVTPSQNINLAYESGVKKKGCEHGRAKLTAEQVRDIRANCVPGDPELGFKPLAKKYNVTSRVIELVYKGVSYKNVE